MLSEWPQKAPRHFYIKAIGLHGLKFIMAPCHFGDKLFIKRDKGIFYGKIYSSL